MLGELRVLSPLHTSSTLPHSRLLGFQEIRGRRLKGAAPLRQPLLQIKLVVNLMANDGKLLRPKKKKSSELRTKVWEPGKVAHAYNLSTLLGG